jgi:signal transduction histidine kinase
MRKDAPSISASTPSAPDAVRVLLVASGPAPRWAGADGTPFRLDQAETVTEAAARLAEAPPDVVVLDAGLASESAAELPRLRDGLGTAALLVRAGGYTADMQALIERLGGSACLLPADAPAPVQAQLVALAAERARFARALAERVEELEQRTAQLEQSRARFRDIIERNADAIIVVDRAGVIRFANGMAAELFHRRQEDLPGTPFGFPVVVGETTELDLPNGGRVRVAEMRVVESEWEGETACIASLRDVTERKRSEERARQLIQEQAARTVAEAAARRFRFRAEASTRLSMPLDFAETLSTLARLCVDEVADWVVIFALDERGALQRLEVQHRDPAKADAARELRELSTARGDPVLSVLRTRSPVLVTDVDDARLAGMAHGERHLSLLRELGVASFMLVPLVARDRALGAIALVSSTPERQFTEDDLADASDLALRAALAVDNVRLYREAERANRAKSDLLAVISHDLRTPLNSIMGHADLLAMGIPDRLSDAGLQRVERIRVGAAHLVYLIDQLLTFARLESGHEERRLQEVNAHTAAREVAAVIEPLALQRALSFHLDLPDRPLALETDPDRLRQVLLNLVGNAVKYTERGEVRLELAPWADGGVVFHVRDTGPGIAPEHLDRIFEPFWQVDPSRRATDGGTGLGLSVVRRMVLLLGGDVAVESVVGRGSTFTVRLPLRPAG